MLIPILIGFAVLGLIAYFRKPNDMRAEMGAWRTPIWTDDTSNPDKRAK